MTPHYFWKPKVGGETCHTEHCPDHAHTGLRRGALEKHRGSGHLRQDPEGRLDRKMPAGNICFLVLSCTELAVTCGKKAAGRVTWERWSPPGPGPHTCTVYSAESHDNNNCVPWTLCAPHTSLRGLPAASPFIIITYDEETFLFYSDT